MTKQDIKKIETELAAMLKEFCENYLDNEYAVLCEKLVKKMGRKKVVPFMSGQLNIWAAAIVHALGSINFLFDKSFEPYITLDTINGYFGTKQATVTNKSKQIRDMFKLDCFNNDFSIQRMIESNPFNKMVMVDGMIVSIDTLPENLQELVKNARKLGKDIEFSTRQSE
ncbi:MAG: DUF6398 domain-containing protein [Spirochaetaceae bacterium]|jgi:hypothetical protein|nr:DUF6398 domain-containing protein [Spirochaetaceae bacterium]